MPGAGGLPLPLGVKQSIFAPEERAAVYDLFKRYARHLDQAGLYDPNLLSHRYLALAEPRYDFVVIDEVQDITNVQLYLILKTLRTPRNFLLCGDSNQIVHPNFFSWSRVKSLFFDNPGLAGNREIIRVLHANYRNAPAVTSLANRILSLKQARFGSIDKESNYLVRSVGKTQGEIRLLPDSDRVKRDLDARTARSTRFAVVVMHPHQKQEARRWFRTPLVFSIQEAKGLEYESVILLNFISSEERAFDEIANGVEGEAVERESLTYRRAGDKRDKSLEIYKFFINALYVGMTRGVRNLYIVESRHEHPVVRLLQLQSFGSEVSLEQQESSIEEWQKEAHKLELQGKQEQADAIRQDILQEKPPPWPVLDRDRFLALRDEALPEPNKKKRLLTFECALINQHYPTLNELGSVGFKPVRQPEEKSLKILYRNHYPAYEMKHIGGGVLRDVEQYGVDHRTVFNLTPLMVAVRIGNVALVETLTDRGANPLLVANNGLNALQMCLQTAVLNRRYARARAATIYPLLLQSVSIQTESRLIKLDDHLMGLFILHLMFALFHRQLGGRLQPFTARDICEYVQHLPAAILPERRKRQGYISSILSGNEVRREARYNRRLFLRVRHGQYVVNPDMKLLLGEEWTPVYSLLRLEDMTVAPPLPSFTEKPVGDASTVLDATVASIFRERGTDPYWVHFREWRVRELQDELRGEIASQQGRRLHRSPPQYGQEREAE